MTTTLAVTQPPFTTFSDRTGRDGPSFTILDPTSPVLRSTAVLEPRGPKPVGSRYDVVPHQGPGTAQYVRQPSQSVLKSGNGVFASASRPFYYPCPEGKPFIDLDGNPCGKRWIMVDPKGGAEEKGACVVM